MNDLISRQEVIKKITSLYEEVLGVDDTIEVLSSIPAINAHCNVYENAKLIAKILDDDICGRVYRGWIDIKYREPDEDEKQEHPDWCRVYYNLPPVDEEVLVTNGKYVWVDTLLEDDGVYFDSDHELDGCSWMTLPEPYQEEGEE